MNISIKATQYELTPSTRNFIEEKLGAIDKLLSTDGETALLAVEVEESISAVRAGARYRVEGTLRAHGRDYRAEALAETLESAVEAVRHELEQELRKQRGKSKSFLKRGGAALKRMLRSER